MPDISNYRFMAVNKDTNACERVEISLPDVASPEPQSIEVQVDPLSGRKTYFLANDASLADLADVISQPDGLSAGQWLIPANRAAKAAELTLSGADRVEVPVAAMGALWGNRAVEPSAAHRGVMNPDGTLGYCMAAAPNLTSVQAFNGSFIVVSMTAGLAEVPNGTYVGQVLNIAFGGTGYEIRVDGSFRGNFRNGQHIVTQFTVINSVIARCNEAWILRWTGAAWERIGGVDQPFRGSANWRENWDGTITVQILGQGSATNLNPGQHVVFDITVPFQMANPTAVVPIVSDYHVTNTPALGIGTIPAATSPVILTAFPKANTVNTVRLGGWHMGAIGSPVSQVGVVNVLLDRVVPDYAALGGIASF